jgi:hypothetical protein
MMWGIRPEFIRGSIGEGEKTNQLSFRVFNENSELAAFYLKTVTQIPQAVLNPFPSAQVTI